MSLTKMQQEYLMHCNHRWNVKTGATGSGKSYLDIMVTIPQRIMHYKGEGLIVLFGNTRGTLERNILEPMREIWSEDNIGNIRQDNTLSMFGKKVYALGADSKKHVARIQGSTIEYAYGDEVTTWSEEVFQMLKSRLRCPHSHFDGTCNPDSPTHWFKTFLDSDADIYQQSYVIDDGVLPPHVVDELKKEYAGTVFYDRYILGKWALAEGLIYPMYQSSVVDSLPTFENGDVMPAKDWCVSIDYGTMNAFAAILWTFRNGVWYAEKEYYYSGRATGVQKTDEDYANDLDAWIAPSLKDLRPQVGILSGTTMPKIPVIIDPSAASFIALMKKKSWCRVIHANNAVLDGIRDTAVALQLGFIKILNSLECWKKEAGGYVWDDKSAEDRPMKENDHLMDATRYFVETKRIAARKSPYTPSLYM